MIFCHFKTQFLIILSMWQVVPSLALGFFSLKTKKEKKEEGKSKELYLGQYIISHTFIMSLAKS
jgi:hypothetical protein